VFLANQKGPNAFKHGGKSAFPNSTHGHLHFQDIPMHNVAHADCQSHSPLGMRLVSST